MRQLFSMARDFWRVSTGRDYFHQPQPLGAYFQDSRCFYNDLRGKAVWNGPRQDGVPVVHIPAWGRDVALPVTVLQFGLGSIDRYFVEGDPEYLDNIASVAKWLLRSLRPDGSFDNRARDLDPHFPYHSDNNGMVQGEALSFCVRVVQHELVEEPVRRELAALAGRTVANMLLPLDEGGTLLRQGGDVFFCEYCRTDGYVVLNGWIYAIFGLMDYGKFAGDDRAAAALSATLKTLRQTLPAFILPSGWSYYDNKNRISSPFYHVLHIDLMDALHRLTGEPEYGRAMRRFRSANVFFNKARYTAVKVLDKLADKQAYLTGR